MNIEEIKQLLDSEAERHSNAKPKLIETHISWVILGNTLVYKVKKPIHYSFLDFSTIDKRLKYCREEIRLNWRLTFNVYLCIIEIRKKENQVMFGGSQGEIIDYAVCMKKLDLRRQMNRLIVRNMVTQLDIKRLADQLIRFHQKASIIQSKEEGQIENKFNDLLGEKEYIAEMIDPKSGEIVDTACIYANKYLSKNTKLMSDRLRDGFYRDVHGDLHTRNIFLLDQPVIFDCIEFNPDYRQIDILNEIAFLCMDLEASKRDDLSDTFLKHYVNHFPLKIGPEETSLFTFYKAYRANVRVKVNCLRAQGSTNMEDRSKSLSEAKKYLCLMNRYMTDLQ